MRKDKGAKTDTAGADEEKDPIKGMQDKIVSDASKQVAANLLETGKSGGTKLLNEFKA